MVKTKNTEHIYRKATNRFLKKSEKKLRSKRERRFIKNAKNEI